MMDFGTVLLILAAGGAFFMAFNNGANDVANSFASAVGAKAISMKQAVLIAGIMNLLGAVLLGGYVSSKLITGVIDPTRFGDPKLYMLAMFSVPIAAGAFVLLSTFLSMPVSSSHSIVGSLIGVSIVVGGLEAVNWGVFTAVVISWFVSPILAALFAMGLLSYIKAAIIKDGEGKLLTRLQIALPIVLGITVGLFALVLTKGSALKAYKPADVGEYLIFMGSVIPPVTLVSWLLLRKFTGMMENSRESVETVFKNLQVGTSSYVAFAHGANDVANSIAPVFAIYLVVNHSGFPTTEILKDASVPLWILVLGGVGIAVGIAALGHRVIETLSKKITTLNNSRGFTVDFSAASTIVIASLLGLPVSSTHAATGAIVGSGLRDGERIERKLLFKIFGMWIITAPAAGLITVLIYLVLKQFVAV